MKDTSIPEAKAGYGEPPEIYRLGNDKCHGAYYVCENDHGAFKLGDIMWLVTENCPPRMTYQGAKFKYKSGCPEKDK